MGEVVGAIVGSDIVGQPVVVMVGNIAGSALGVLVGDVVET